MNLFLRLLLILLFSCSQLPKKTSKKLSILQGVTNAKEVEFNILSKKGDNLNFELKDESGNAYSPDQIKTVSRDFSDFEVYKVLFNKSSKKLYNLFVYRGGKVIDQRLVGIGQRDESKLKVAVISCMSDYYSNHFKIWNTLAKKNPEYILMIGDNVYADQNGPSNFHTANSEILWNRYVDARMTYPFFFQEKLIPVHALWDDHDYGNNNADSTFQFKSESKNIFDTFFAQDLASESWEKGHGVGGLLSLGDFNLYFLDSRTFRSPDKESTHLGLDQTAWLYSKLRDEKTPSLLIKGDQFFGGYHTFESFEGNHPENFLEFIAQLKKISTPIVFLSGDRHLSEIMQFPRGLFGKPSFEITSSPLHARAVTFEETKNPWRVVAEVGHVNFTIIENSAIDDHWFLDVENFGENGERYFKRELAVFIKDLQDNLKETKKRRFRKRRYRRIKRKRKSKF